MPKYELSQELYHEPDCDNPLFGHGNVDAAKETRHATAEELEEEGYEPCSCVGDDSEG